MIKYSIIVPIYNVEEYLIRAISSVLNQNYNNFELILVDDGANDLSTSISDYFATLDDRVIVIHRTNGGLSAARNSGLSICSGDFVLFLDSDDYITLDTLSDLSCFIDSQIDVLFFDSFKDINSINVEFSNYQPGKYSSELFLSRRFPISACLGVVRRETIVNNSIYFKEGFLHEDLDYIPKVLLHSTNIYVTRNKHYIYFVRPGSIMHAQKKENNLLDIFNICIGLSKTYSTISNNMVRSLLEDELVYHLLSIYNMVDGYQFKHDYLYFSFLSKFSHYPKTKIKASLFCISPRLYCLINRIIKKVRHGINYCIYANL